jgi:hypothetical protein
VEIADAFPQAEVAVVRGAGVRGQDLVEHRELGPLVVIFAVIVGTSFSLWPG